MNEDIRIDWGFLRNLKTLKLSRDLGGNPSDPLVCLIRFWIYVAEHHHRGTLTKMDPEDVESVAGWTGQKGAFFTALSRQDPDRSPWIDIDDNGVISVHDWEEHQPWVFHRDRRVEHAKLMNDRRWGQRLEGKKKKKKHRQGSKQGSQKDILPGSNAGSSFPAPAPPPAPLAGRRAEESSSTAFSDPVEMTPEEREQGLKTIKSALSALDRPGRPKTPEPQDPKSAVEEEEQRPELTPEEKAKVLDELDEAEAELIEQGVEPSKAEKITKTAKAFRLGEIGLEHYTSALAPLFANHQEKIRILAIPGLLGPRP